MWAQEGREELLNVRGQEGQVIQGNEQWLCFSGAAVKKYPMSKRNPSKTVGAEGGHQRADRLKLQSRTSSQSDHMNHSLV